MAKTIGQILTQVSMGKGRSISRRKWKQIQGKLPHRGRPFDIRPKRKKSP